MSDIQNEKPKTLTNEKLPDPSAAPSELKEGDPRSRTAAHLRRIITASVTLPLVAGISSCQIPFQVVDPVPPPAVIPQPVATLSIKTPEAAVAMIDERSAGQLTATNSVSLAAGTRKITLTSTTRSPSIVVNLQVGAGPINNVSRTVIIAILKVQSATQVKVDDKPAARVTPEEAVELSAGPHTIEFSLPADSDTQTFSLEIKAIPRQQ
jgi:hypothetical protein